MQPKNDQDRPHGLRHMIKWGWPAHLVPMEVNTMTGLIPNESDREESNGDLYAMQPENSWFFLEVAKV